MSEADAVWRGSGKWTGWRFYLLSLCWAVVATMALQEWGERSVPGSIMAPWRPVQARVPVQLASLNGDLPHRSNALNLQHFSGVLLELPPSSSEDLELRFQAWLPPASNLGASFLQPSTAGPHSFEGIVANLDISGRAQSGWVTTSGAGQSFLETATPLKPLMPALAWRSVVASLKAGKLRIELDGVVLASGETRVRPTLLRLQSGLARVHVDDVTIRSHGTTWFSDDFTHPWRRPLRASLLFALLLALVVGLEKLERAYLEGRGCTQRSAQLQASLTWSPLLLLLLVDAEHLGEVLEALRLVQFEPTTLTLTLAAGTTVLFKLSAMLARASIGTPDPSVTSTSARETAESSGFAPVHPRAHLLAMLLSQTMLVGLLAGGLMGRPLIVLTPVISLLWAGYTRWPGYAPALWRRTEGIVTLVLGLPVLVRLISLYVEGGAPALLSRPGERWTGLAYVTLAATLVIRLFMVNRNAGRLRAPNLMSLILTLAIVLTVEGAARSSSLNASMLTESGIEAFSSFNALVRDRQFREWPDKLFPTAFPRRGPQVTFRMVCLGGSSTAGAYQMRDLTRFYPALLERSLRATPGREQVEVINQGVGGWNTLLIRFYLEGMLESLDPDLLTFYIGHNDIMTRSSVPYRFYWDQYMEAGTTRKQSLQGLLNRSRIYVLTKQMLLYWRDGTGGSAVPVADARENLSAIIQLAQKRGTRVLLMSEGLNPSPEPLSAYFAMMEDLARQNDLVWYLDTANALNGSRSNEYFLDSCHLTDAGHALVSKHIGDFLEGNPDILGKPGSAGQSGSR